MNELSNDIDVQWIREHNGKITACLLEKYFTPEDLKDELELMRTQPGTVKRVLASRTVIGEQLKLTAK